ncbi:HORMA domain-containing protein 1-like [Argiope bruennichi]|uniref:HORMA domain-containing protein 1-like n=1 Tax=Argiope bruennichi TaxID=94029 RepID=UPI002495A4D9|nr:HORMA domain-containing protein 1-like [Argiope bruennichi]
MTAQLMMTPMQEWKTIFPDFITLEGSCLFIKKLIAVSLSAVTYIRGIFPEKAYGERNLYGLRLKLLTEDSGMKSVTKFINLIRGCYDAVEKKYLQQLSIGICLNKENRNEVIEAYNLVFSYKDDECSVTYQNKTNSFSPKLTDPTVEASLLMLKNISVINNILGELPKNAYLSLKLLYYDDVTPDDYEPPGFEPSTHAKFSFPTKTMNIALGKVNTKIHGFKFLLKTTVNKQSSSQNNTEDPLSLLPDSQMSNTDEATQDDISKEELFNSESLTDESPLRNIIKNTKVHPALKCPCKSKLATNYDTIICVSCELLQHKVCYGILKPNDMPEIFYCVDCIILNSDDRMMSLDIIYTYQGKERQELCALRRALALCLTLETITNSDFQQLFGYNTAATTALIQNLVYEDFLIEIPGTEKYEVQKSQIIEYGLQKYFPTNHEENGRIFEKDSKNDSRQKHYQSYSPDISSSVTNIDIVQTPVKEVKALSLSNKSPNQGNIPNKRKRKVSSKILSNDESEEAFSSQKKQRTKKKRR